MVDHTRHIGLFLPIQEPITLIGAGGIGAITGLMLAKMSDGEIDIYDDDIVDDINLATQFHTREHVGLNKSESLKVDMNAMSDSCTVIYHNTRFPYEIAEAMFQMFPAKYVISAVDSINSRKAIWNHLRGYDNWEWYLDARMSAEVFQLYTVERELQSSVLQYDEMIWAQNEEDIPEIACTMKATIYTACIAAGHIGKTLREITTGINPPYWLEHDIVRERILVAYGTKGRPTFVQDS